MSAYQIQVNFKLLIPKKIRKYSELKTCVKKLRPVEAVYALLVTLPTKAVIPHTLLDVFKRLDPSVCCSWPYNDL